MKRTNRNEAIENRRFWVEHGPTFARKMHIQAPVDTAQMGTKPQAKLAVSEKVTIPPSNIDIVK